MAEPPLHWNCRPGDGWILAEFTAIADDDLIDHHDLSRIRLPDAVHTHIRSGLILSGRGPIWLYGHLVHLAHPFAWVALHDPRLGGAVVVMRHLPDAPTLGSLVPVDPVEVPSENA